jgi:hypothetical protein
MVLQHDWFNLKQSCCNVLVEPVWLAIEHKAGFQPLLRVAKTRGSQEQAEFERHIEPGKAVLIQFGARQVVDAPSAIPDQSDDLFDSDLSAVGTFQGTTGSKAALEDRENQSVADRTVGQVKGTVNENVLSIVGNRLPVSVAMIRFRLSRHILSPNARGPPASPRAVWPLPGHSVHQGMVATADRPGLAPGRSCPSVWRTLAWPSSSKTQSGQLLLRTPRICNSIMNRLMKFRYRLSASYTPRRAAISVPSA